MGSWDCRGCLVPRHNNMGVTQDRPGSVVVEATIQTEAASTPTPCKPMLVALLLQSLTDLGW